MLVWSLWRIWQLTLEKLIKKRQNLIEAHRENDFTDGIHALLTDLYPDTAHFIYELLQNAEDMNATVVRFILDESSIHFEHNGTKRAFNIADIDAITSIGRNSQKKDDPTSIGKFGVGFKAVFAYTSTPIIHSGDYHFKIRFHINAPFASTVARDSVRNCRDNEKLIRAISQLISDSLPEIKSQGLMNHSFFEVLPNKKDNLSKFYHCISNCIYTAFQRNDYLPTRNGGYTSAKNALSGPQAIFNFMKEADMCELFNIEKTWITNAAQRNSDADNFIQNLGIQTFTFKDFAEMFETSFRAKQNNF